MIILSTLFNIRFIHFPYFIFSEFKSNFFLIFIFIYLYKRILAKKLSFFFKQINK